MKAPAYHRRGSILIIAMWIIVALTGLVLIMSYNVRVEAGAIANRVAQAQVDAAERGVEKYLLSLVSEEVATPGTLENLGDTYFQQRQVGDCYFWVIRPDYDDPQTMAYGLLDEAARLDLNTANKDTLLKLPGMSEDLSDTILDWRDSDSTVRPQGAEDEYYLSQPEPYRTKNSSYESIDELLLVKGITPDILYGYDHNRNGVLDDRESQAGGMASQVNASGSSARGLYPFITIWGLQAASSRAATPGTATPGTATPGTATPGTATGSSGASVADVNSQNTNNLRTVIRNTLGDSRVEEIVGQATRGRPFANVFDFRFRAGLTQDEFKQLFTQLTASPQTPQGGQPPPTRALININRAPQEVLLCLPDLDQSDVSSIISKRESNQDDPANIAWLADALTQQKAVAIGSLVTGLSQCFSAEIVTVSGDGRAFKRCQVVMSAKQGAAQVIYRKDKTSFGWPLAPELRDELRSGAALESDSPLRGVR